MKKLLVTLFILIISFSVSAQTKRPVVKPTPRPSTEIATPITETEATTKDGKKVILKSDKTWDFAKEDSTAKSEPLIESAVSSGYLKTPFDLNVSKLPRNFVGHDFGSIYEGSMGTRPFKSEFETTEAYLQKVANRQALDKTSMFAVFPKQPFLAYDLSYNADSQKFKVELRFEDKDLFFLSPFKYILDFDQLITSSELTGSNILGRSGILVHNHEKLTNSFLFSAEPERAKLIKADASLLVIFSLSPPYAYARDDRQFSWVAGKASLIRTLLVGEITGLWLVNKETGEIYQKLDFPK